MTSDTKSALLDTAERAARTRGIDGFSFADLAEVVGIRKASIHHHFPTKAKLSVAVMQRYSDTLEASCAEIAAAHTTGAQRLAALIALYRCALDGGQSLCLCVSFSTSRASLPAEVIDQISRFRLMMIEQIASMFALGRDDGSIANVEQPVAEATATLSLLEGAQLAARAEEKPELFDAVVALLSRRLSSA